MGWGCLQLKKMNQQQQLREGSNSSFPEGFSLPALELPTKNYSLDADIATGWQPKMKVVGPIPLNFDSAVVDEIVETLTMLGHRGKERVIYLGWRYASSFKLHQEMKRPYIYKYQSLINTNFPHLAAYFRKFYNHFKPKHSRIFKGMNPTLKDNQDSVFDSNFQSGNLDAAIRVAPGEYDLFMRVDSNTRGHVQWFNFTVKSNGLKKIKINIVNFRKYHTLYSQSLRPYVFSSIHPKNGWRQGCSNIRYDQRLLRYEFLAERFNANMITYNCLSFEYEFENNEEVIQLAYCPPFTYSDNLTMIASLHSKSPLESPIIKEEILAESLGGLELPLLTITDPQVPNDTKKCILVTARIHPGETCGSYMMKGFLEFICSNHEQAKYLRKIVVFKVIPMMNPDGVVLGNFRTSLCGRDLNRMFTSEQGLLIPQVKAIKNLVTTLKQEYRSRLMFFIDFHGHSVRKNVFVYGPEYDIWETNYYRTRILPKILGEKTQIFRYYSCVFRISEWKRTTARAVFLRQIPHCYTVEASVGSYYSTKKKEEVPFTTQGWEFMGKTIAQGLQEFFQMIQDPDFSKKKEHKKDLAKPKKFPDIKQQQLPRVKPKEERPHQSAEDRHSHLKHIEKELLKDSKNEPNIISQRAHAIMQEIKQDESKKHTQNYSEGGSDSEDASEDLGEKEISNLHQQIIISLKEFKDRFYNRNKDENNPRSRNFLRSSEQIPKRGIQMIASLRKKAQNLSHIKGQAEPELSNSKQLTRKQQWLKSRTQSIRKPEYRPESQSFQVYVNKIKFLSKGEGNHCQNKIKYFSPRKKRDANNELSQD